MKTTRTWGIGGLAACLVGITSEAAPAQVAAFLGGHEVETLPYEIPGTGRIGGVALDPYGYLYVANQDEGVWKLHPGGEVEHFVRGLYGSSGGVMLANGDLLHGAYNGDDIVRVERDGTRHDFVREGLQGPVGMVRVGDIVYVANAKSDWIGRVSLDGRVEEFVRDERFRIPNGITADREGNLFVVNLGNTLVLRVTPAGEVSQVARLPGTANAHVALAGGALYVTQIWSHVILRVEMDGAWTVVAGDGTPRARDGFPDESRVPYPNGIVATTAGDVLYFNTLEGDMVAGHPGTIRVHRLHVPTPDRAFERAHDRGGIEGLRGAFDLVMSLQDAPREQILAALYGAARRLLTTGRVEAGMSLATWTSERDPDELRRASMLGRFHGVFGNATSAVQHLARAVELAPDDATLASLLEAARAYRRH